MSFLGYFDSSWDAHLCLSDSKTQFFLLHILEFHALIFLTEEL